MYVVGIDENGFGPILGPLAVTATAFKIDEPYSPDYLWDCMRAVVSKTAKDFPEKIIVFNSKEVFRSKQARSYQVLEATVLNFFELLGGRSPLQFKDFLSGISLEGLKCELERTSEICDVKLPLPIWADRKDIAHREALKKELARTRVSLKEMRTIIVCPGRFNSSLSSHGSKFYLNWLQFEKIIEHVVRRFSGSELSILCGKIGGQKNYAPYFARGWLRHFKVEKMIENGALSCYRLWSKGTEFDLSFIARGDRHHFPIALASLFGKYIREAFMYHQNSVFQAREPSLGRVSGYRDRTTRTFIDESCKIREDMGLSDRCFLRDK